MSLLDKKLFLRDLGDRLAGLVPANTGTEIIEQVADILGSYNVEFVKPQEEDSAESNEMINVFLSAKAIEGRSEQTIKQYRYVLEKLKREIVVPFAKVNVHHLRSWMSKERERGISLATLESNRFVISSFFGWLWKEELISKNPAVNLAPIKRQKVIRKPYSDVEIEKLRDAAKSTRDIAIIFFLLTTGCRVSEVCGLNAEDIDLRSKSVKVLGKGSKERIVYFDDVTAFYLEKWLGERKNLGAGLFNGKGSERLTPSSIRFMLNNVAKRAGVEKVHPHKFRRTLATNLISHGMPIQEVAKILGHDKIDTTLKYVYIDQRSVETSYRKYA